MMNGTTKVASLPYFTRGMVVKGFGRGSKELGIPTANYPESVVEVLPSDISAGVYCGYGQVNGGSIYKMVMSIGWNPYYNNTKKSMETHLIHKFESDFYGQELALVILGYIRPELNFDSLEELVYAIEGDIEFAKKMLDLPESKSYLHHDFFTSNHSSAIDEDGDETRSNL